MNQYKDLANTGIQKISPYIPGKPIAELKRELGATDIIKLASNENPHGPSPEAIKKIKSFNDFSRYPDGCGFYVKHCIADKENIAPQCITLGNGSNDVLQMLADCFLNTNNCAMYDKHCFTIYPLITLSNGAFSIVIDSHSEHHEMPYGHDCKRFIKALTKDTRIIFLANPNNPTGTWFNQQALIELLDNTPKETLVVLDEAYKEYVNTPDYPDSISLLKTYPNLVITRTFSKAYGLAALRIGYAISNPEISTLLNSIRQPFNVNCLALTAAEAAMKDQQYLQYCIEQNQLGLTYLRAQLAQCGLTYLPSMTNFLCINLQQNAHLIYQRLLERGIITRIAHLNMENYLRVSVGTDEENKRFIQTLKAVI